MKTRLHSAFCFLRSSFLPVTTGALCLAALPTWAQDDAVTISAADFQRMVYSAHLHTQLAGKPELDASLQALLELHRRNPSASAPALADLSRQALQRYRASAPAYIRTNGFRDEILAAYLDALRQVPARTNFIPANLALLNGFMLSPGDYATASPAELMHSGNQRLLASEGEALKRQAVVDNCLVRAQASAAFATALNNLLSPETLVSLDDSPVQIIGNPNSPLHDNLTMQTLLALSAASGNGSLTVSSNQLMDLFTSETQTLWDTIHTNLALRAEINQTQPDLLAYLTNQAAIDADAQRQAAVKQGQARVIASSTAAILVQSELQQAKNPLIPLPSSKETKAIGAIMSSIATALNIMGNDKAKGLTKIMASGNFIGAGLQVFNLLTGTESSEDKTAREIGNIKTLVNDLSTNMNYRFDRVDQSLTTIFDQLNEQFANIVIIGGKIDHINGNVDEIRRSLVGVQTDLDRLERHLLSYVNQLCTRNNNLNLNTYLGFEATHTGLRLTQDDYNKDAEPVYFTQARDNAVDGLSSPYSDRNYTISDLYSELTESAGGTTNRLDQNLSYLKKYLNDVLLQPTDGILGQLANPRDWFVGAYAYAQLSVENPMYFRQINPSNRLDLITARGRDLTNFFRSLTFTGANINWPLYSALENFYVGKLVNFTDQVRFKEQQYAAEHHIPTLEAWRQWGLAAPQVTATATELLESHRERPVVPPELIPLGSRGLNGIIALGGDHNGSHGLALQSEGTIAAWEDFDQWPPTSVPSGLSNVVAVAAGVDHYLVLTEGGTVVAWGNNYSDSSETSCPPSATNVMAIGTGPHHNLAVRKDGRVVGWGDNYYGQATGVPSTSVPFWSTGLVSVAGQTITNAVAAGGGYNYSLALKTDGKVVAWGTGGSAETNVPAGLNDVVAIAAGGAHCLALSSNGTVVAWGLNNDGQTNVPPGLSNVVAVAAGGRHSLALRGDGTVAAWGEGSYGQTNVPAGLSNVVAIAADQLNSLALRRDGTLVAWGLNNWLWEGLLPVPAGLTNVVAVDGGDFHILALRADGTVTSWGATYYDYGQSRVPVGLSNVVAVAAGDYHSLALSSNGIVFAWGLNDCGQTNVPNDLGNVVAITAGNKFSVALKSDGTVVKWGVNIVAQPADVTNVVAISAGEYHFCLALTADGRVRAWGDNYFKQCDVPANATNIVAIAAGYFHSLALRADGTVVAWGSNDGGCTDAPAGLSNVVAIAAGYSVSVALKADGTAIAWGSNSAGQSNVPGEVTNTVAIGAGYLFSLYVKSTGNANAAPGLNLVRSPFPTRVRDYLWAVNELVLTNLDLDLHEAGIDVSGSKSLFQAVLELGMPYTLERDDVLQGFLYGSESVVDLEASRAFLKAENLKRQMIPASVPQALTDVAVRRYLCFNNRLSQCLTNLAAQGQPEIPRLVGHTLRLLNLLRDSYATVPPPTLQMWSESASPRLLLYGEPYAHYTLQYHDTLNVSGWTTTTLTNLHEGQIITNLPPFSSGAQRFYRTMLPLP